MRIFVNSDDLLAITKAQNEMGRIRITLIPPDKIPSIKKPKANEWIEYDSMDSLLNRKGTLMGKIASYIAKWA